MRPLTEQFPNTEEDDLNKYFKGSFVKVPLKYGGPVPYPKGIPEFLWMQILECSKSLVSGKIYIAPNSIVAFTTHADTFVCEVPSIRPGFYQNGVLGVYIHEIASAGGELVKKGLCDRRLRIDKYWWWREDIFPTERYSIARKWMNKTHSFPTLFVSLFEAPITTVTPPPLWKLFKAFLKRKTWATATLNPDFCISRGFDRPILWYHSWPVAVFPDDKNPKCLVWNPACKHFKTEVMDMVVENQMEIHDD